MIICLPHFDYLQCDSPKHTDGDSTFNLLSWMLILLHILSAMEGLTQSYMLKQKLLNCEPIDLIRFVVDLRDSHLEFWTSFSDSATAKRLLIISGAHCLHKELWLPILPIGFPGTCFLTFLEMLSAAWLVSDFASTPFVLNRNLEFYLFPYLQLMWGWW